MGVTTVKPDTYPYVITNVRASVLDQTIPLFYNAETEKWEATFTAPGATSWWTNGTWHAYNVRIDAENWVGSENSIDGNDTEQLRLRVREVIPPIVLLTNPTDGAYISNNKPTFQFTLTDEEGGSGVDTDTIDFKINGSKVPVSLINITTVGSYGFRGTYTPEEALADGKYEITLTVKDHDENIAVENKINLTIDTVPPTLVILNPAAAWCATNQPRITVAGTTNDNLTSFVKIVITHEHGGLTIQREEVSVDVTDGSFAFDFVMLEGDNTFTITATDLADQTTTVVREVTLDTHIPELVEAYVVPTDTTVGNTVEVYAKVV